MDNLTLEELAVVDEMSNQGDAFIKALAQCFRLADRANVELLKKTFPLIWSDYSAMSKWDNNLAEQADQDYKEGKFHGDAYLQ
jgi:hypothetical protein